MISNIGRISLRALDELPTSEVSSLLKGRCRLIKDIVGESAAIRRNVSFEKNREMSIIMNLYRDTESIVSEIESATKALMTKAEAYRQLDSLGTRHGLLTETISEAYKSMIAPTLSSATNTIQSRAQMNSDAYSLIETLVEEHCRFNVIFERYKFKYSATKSSQISYCNVNDLCIDSHRQATFVAEHQENWSPEFIMKYASNMPSDLNRDRDRDRVRDKDKGAFGVSPSSFIVASITPYVQFILVELFKNALSSTITKFKLTNDVDVNKVDIFSDSFKNSVSPVHVTLSYQHRGYHNIRSNNNSNLNDSDNRRIYLTVSVADQGLGMSEEQVRDAFIFLKGATTSVSDLVKSQGSYQPRPYLLQGLGAGLRLSKIYSNILGGDISLQSEGLSRGATVTLWMPVQLERELVWPMHGI